jgi:hypothetical protein
MEHHSSAPMSVASPSLGRPSLLTAALDGAAALGAGSALAACGTGDGPSSSSSRTDGNAGGNSGTVRMWS